MTKMLDQSMDNAEVQTKLTHNNESQCTCAESQCECGSKALENEDFSHLDSSPEKKKVDFPVPRNCKDQIWKKKRCFICPCKRNKKTPTTCGLCKKHVCPEHSYLYCGDCSCQAPPIGLSRQQQARKPRKRKRCRFCPHKKDKKIKSFCCQCERPICNEHSYIHCSNCTMFFPPWVPEEPSGLDTDEKADKQEDLKNLNYSSQFVSSIVSKIFAAEASRKTIPKLTIKLTTKSTPKKQYESLLLRKRCLLCPDKNYKNTTAFCGVCKGHVCKGHSLLYCIDCTSKAEEPKPGIQNKKREKKLCGFCPFELNRKILSFCCHCERHICREHSFLHCYNCTEAALKTEDQYESTGEMDESEYSDYMSSQEEPENGLSDGEAEMEGGFENLVSSSNSASSIVPSVGETESTPNSFTSSQSPLKRKRCSLCPHKKDKKTTSFCGVCKNHVCMEHSLLYCGECSPRAEMPKDGVGHKTKKAKRCSFCPHRRDRKGHQVCCFCERHICREHSYLHCHNCSEFSLSESDQKELSAGESFSESGEESSAESVDSDKTIDL